MAFSKIILNGTTLMDVTDLTADSGQVLNGYTSINNAGVDINGSYSPPTFTTQSKTVSYTPTESQQTATITPDNGYDGLEEVDVTVGAISSTYVGSGITQRSSSDLTASGATVTAPAGYYSSQATKTISSGTAGTPTATKGTVSNHSVSVTPSVTNTTGYITGSTKTGTAVTVSASELVSGSLSITSNNTYDVTNYASAVVNVSGSGGIGTLLNTTSIGTVSTTSTQQSNLNKDLSVSGINDYDLLIVESSVDTLTASRHAATIRLIFLTGSNSIGTKNGNAIATATLNIRVGSTTSTFTSNTSTTAYGVYAYSCSISSGTATIPMYRRYNQTSTGTINGTYTARVYGVKLKDLIGG